MMLFGCIRSRDPSASLGTFASLQLAQMIEINSAGRGGKIRKSSTVSGESWRGKAGQQMSIFSIADFECRDLAPEGAEENSKIIK